MGQLIITIGRENGSGGRDIASRVADKLKIPFYDVRILMDVAKDMNLDLDPGELTKFDEAPRNLIASRRIRGEYTNSLEEVLALKQFEYLRNKAQSGESFVVLGRCADYILKDYKGLLKVFVTADKQAKIDRIAIRHNVSKDEAEKIIKKTDKSRKHYYERYSHGNKWGDSDWHDIVIKSNTIGIDKTADILVKFIHQYEQKLYPEDFNI